MVPPGRFAIANESVGQRRWECSAILDAAPNIPPTSLDGLRLEGGAKHTENFFSALALQVEPRDL